MEQSKLYLHSPSRSDFKSVESKREHSSLLPHTEPLKHFIDDILRRIFAGEVTEGIQRIVHTDRYGIQPEPAADRIQRTGHCIPRAGCGGKLALA